MYESTRQHTVNYYRLKAGSLSLALREHDRLQAVG